MINFLMQNIGTIVVMLMVAAVLTLAVLKLYRDKKNGKSSCGCKCAGCPNSSVCNDGKNKNLSA